MNGDLGYFQLIGNIKEKLIWKGVGYYNSERQEGVKGDMRMSRNKKTKMEEKKNIGHCHGNVFLAIAYWSNGQIK